MTTNQKQGKVVQSNLLQEAQKNMKTKFFLALTLSVGFFSLVVLYKMLQDEIQDNKHYMKGVLNLQDQYTKASIKNAELLKNITETQKKLQEQSEASFHAALKEAAQVNGTKGVQYVTFGYLTMLYIAISSSIVYLTVDNLKEDENRKWISTAFSNFYDGASTKVVGAAGYITGTWSSIWTKKKNGGTV